MSMHIEILRKSLNGTLFDYDLSRDFVPLVMRPKLVEAKDNLLLTLGLGAILAIGARVASMEPTKKKFVDGAICIMTVSSFYTFFSTAHKMASHMPKKSD